jgi:hypothetical protein
MSSQFSGSYRVAVHPRSSDEGYLCAIGVMEAQSSLMTCNVKKSDSRAQSDDAGKINSWAAALP